MQISPEYIAKFNHLKDRVEDAQDIIDRVERKELEMNDEHLNIIKFDLENKTKELEDFDSKVRGWEKIDKKKKIDHRTGFVI